LRSLEGDEVERLCVVDLGRDWRMIVAFPGRDGVAVILVGRHNARDTRPAAQPARRHQIQPLALSLLVMTEWLDRYRAFLP
jgi:hypothetical protein